MINFKDNSILIVPNNIKSDIIKDIRLNNKDLNIKIFSLDEFIKLLTFDYDEKTIYEIMKLYNIKYDIAKLYLNNMCYINDFTGIEKLDNIYNIKKSVDKFLIKDNLFKLLIKNKEIFVYGYDYISKFHRYILNTVPNLTIMEKEYNIYKHDVY